MGGPNLEVFKFGCYVFFPIYTMLKFGDPEWYEVYVKPYRDLFWPEYESTHRPPKSSAELHTELARFKAEREAKRSGISQDHSQGVERIIPPQAGGVLDNLPKPTGTNGWIQDASERLV